MGKITLVNGITECREEDVVSADTPGRPEGKSQIGGLADSIPLHQATRKHLNEPPSNGFWAS